MSEENSLQLSPPWYTFFNFVKHSIGKDPGVKVLDMKELSGSNFLIPIEVGNRDKAAALATILVPGQNFGDTNVSIEILHCGKTVKPMDQPQDVCCLIKKALDTNYYFDGVEMREVFDFIIVFPVFKKAVIQFFNDDLSDLYNNFNGVAADVFAEVLESMIDGRFIYPSTANQHSLLP